MANENLDLLRQDHYHVHVSYRGMSPYEALKKKWGKDNVSVIFDGRSFTLHSSCVGMDRTPGERVFYLHNAGGDWESEERIAWGLTQRNEAAPNGYRPATEEETYEFAEAHPELADFVGLGAFAMYCPCQLVARVSLHGGQRFLCYWIDRTWNGSFRFLFVRK